MLTRSALWVALVCTLLSTCALAQTRTWGNNYQGQLGDGFRGLDDPAHIQNPTPITIGGLADVIAVSGGDGHTLAARSDGTVMTWGPAGRPSSLTPVSVTILTNVIAVSAGFGHSLALKSDGTVWAWGNNGSGELGDFFKEGFSAVPVQVGVGQFSTTPGFDSIVAIEAGLGHSLALKADGTVWAWGGNGDGQLGLGDNGPRFSPQQIPGLAGMIAIGGGDQHSIALKSDGTLWGWGQNGAGQLGDGTLTGPDATTMYWSPVQNPLISGVTQIATTNLGSVALKSDGTVWAWGYNEFGMTGNGTRTTANQCQCESTPMQATIANVSEIESNGGTHILARKIDGSIWAWGYNAEGEGGTGAVSPQFPDHYSLLTPTQSSVGTGNVIFGTGRAHSMLAVPTVPVAAGAGIIARLGAATLTFGSVSTAGNATITAVDPTTIALSPPVGFTVQTHVQAYDISTTATFAGATVCLKVPMIFDQTAFNRLRILHAETGALVDRTSSRDYFRREVCGPVTSLSTFLIADALVVSAPVLTGAASRKSHGASGTFDLPLTVTAPPTINHAPTTEPRVGPSFQLVFTYDKALNAATVTVTEGVATASSAVVGSTIVVDLTSVIDRQYVTVSLTNVSSTDGGAGGVGGARVGFLTGDVNGSRLLAITDLVVVNNQLGKPLTAANFLSDVNASGVITVLDKVVVNNNLGHFLPAP